MSSSFKFLVKKFNAKVSPETICCTLHLRVTVQLDHAGQAFRPKSSLDWESLVLESPVVKQDFIAWHCPEIKGFVHKRTIILFFSFSAIINAQLIINARLSRPRHRQRDSVCTWTVLMLQCVSIKFCWMTRLDTVFDKGNSMSIHRSTVNQNCLWNSAYLP